MHKAYETQPPDRRLAAVCVWCGFRIGRSPSPSPNRLYFKFKMYRFCLAWTFHSVAVSLTIHSQQTPCTQASEEESQRANGLLNKERMDDELVHLVMGRLLGQSAVPSCFCTRPSIVRIFLCCCKHADFMFWHSMFGMEVQSAKYPNGLHPVFGLIHQYGQLGIDVSVEMVHMTGLEPIYVRRHPLKCDDAAGPCIHDTSMVPDSRNNGR